MPEHDEGQRGGGRELRTALARAFGGAIFFSLPLLMTMEMWWLGFYMGPLRLALLMTLMIPVLIVLSHYSGIRNGTSWPDDIADAFVAWTVAFAAGASVLLLFNVIDSRMDWREVLGKVSLQAVPASFGAMLANSEFGGGEREKSRDEARGEFGGYRGELFLMFVGALFVAFNVAPTEEMILIAFKMSYLHAILLAVASLLMMHGFIYSASFSGAPERGDASGWELFLRFTVVGYAIALVVSAYVLWTFGRYQDHDYPMHVMMAVTLAFPAGLGVAAARLVI